MRYTVFGLGTYSDYVLRDPAFELNLLPHPQRVPRVAALMLGYLRTCEGRYASRPPRRRSERRPWSTGRASRATLQDGLLSSLAGTALPLDTARRQPDVLVLDLGMPWKDGLAVIRELRTAGLSTRVVFLTAARMKR